MVRSDPQINIRLPAELKAQIAALAKNNNRSMNAEIIDRLEASLLEPASEVEIKALRTSLELVREDYAAKSRELEQHIAMHRVPPRDELSGLPVLYLLLDADGYPLSWHETFEHIKAVTKAGKLSAVNLQVRLLHTELVSSKLRAEKTAQIADRYRKLLGGKHYKHKPFLSAVDKEAVVEEIKRRMQEHAIGVQELEEGSPRNTRSARDTGD